MSLIYLNEEKEPFYPAALCPPEQEESALTLGLSLPSTDCPENEKTRDICRWIFCDTDFEATQNTKLGELVHSSKHKGRLKLNRKASDPGLSLLSLFLKYINDMWHKICETTMLIKRASTQSCLLYWLSALPYYFNPHNNNMNPGGDREPAWPWAQYRNSVMSILGNILFACNTVLNYLYSVQEALGRV